MTFLKDAQAKKNSRLEKSSFVRKCELEEVRENKGLSLNERYKLRAARIEVIENFSYDVVDPRI
jgi:hypothetical protein